MLVYQNSEKPPKEALLDLLTTYFTPLYENIMSSTHMGNTKNLQKNGLDTDSLDLIWQVQDILKKVYSYHFPEEYFKEDDYTSLDILKGISQSQFFKFCREFNIIPNMIPKGLGLTIFNDIIDIPLNTLYSQNILDDKSEDCGWIFTFSRFLFFQLKINEITFTEAELQSTSGSLAGSPSENLQLIQNQFQSSGGFYRFQQTQGSNNSMISLCPSMSQSSLKKSFQSIGMISQSERKNFLDRSNSQLKNSTIRSLYKAEHIDRMSTLSMLSSHTKRLRSMSKNKILEKEIQYCEDQIPIFEQYTEDLCSVFEAYATIGEPMNTDKLKSIKFHRQLRDADILTKGNSLNANPKAYQKESKTILNVSTGSSEIKSKRYMTPIDADFIFIQLTGSKFRNDCNSKSFPWNRRVVSPTLKRPSHLGKCSGTQKVVDSKLEFATFLKALEMIAQKMYPEIDVQSSIKIIIEKVCKLRDSKHVEQRTIGFHQITHLKDFQQDESQMRILATVHKNIGVYFKYYADSRARINQTAFIKFLTDFEIFPIYISKARINKFFYTLAALETVEPDITTIDHLCSKLSSMSSRTGPRMKINPDQTELEVLDDNLFVEALCLIAIEIYDMTEIAKSNEDKLILFLHQQDTSKGPKQIQTKLGVTRAKNGFNWSLLKGLEQQKELLLYKSKIKQDGSMMTFNSMYK